MTKFLFAAILAAGAILPAHAQSIGILPAPVPARYAELKAYLVLTDAQLTALMQIQQQKADAERAFYAQISAKQQELNNLLNAGSRDANRVGQLMIDIQTLRKQLPLPSDSYRAQAQALLTQEQKNKLPALTSALQLATPAYQAVNINLVVAPAPSVQPRILPAVLEPGMVSSTGVFLPEAETVNVIGQQ
jgi:hypothetical protein